MSERNEVRAEAKRQGVMVQLAAAGTNAQLTTADGAVHVLPPVTLAVYQAADGRTAPGDLLAAARRVDAAATLTHVYAALDALADADLLVGRVAPPAEAGLDRRTAIRTMALAAGAALAVLPRAARSAAPVVAPATARIANEEEKKAQLVKKRKSEQEYKAKVTAVAARADEEAKKVAAATPADAVALRSQEQATKSELDTLSAQAKEQDGKVLALEQAARLQ